MNALCPRRIGRKLNKLLTLIIRRKKYKLILTLQMKLFGMVYSTIRNASEKEQTIISSGLLFCVMFICYTLLDMTYSKDVLY